MKPTKHPQILSLIGLAALLATLSLSPDARANVYATNIKLNGSLTNTTASVGSSVAITYILNEPATAGATINIRSNATVIDTISIASGNAGTLAGLNTVTWGGTNSGGGTVPAGNYSVSITAAATGYADWTQTSVDSSNTTAVFPQGMDVDKNTNSPYYGRVVVGCSVAGTAHGVAQLCGFYKANADGSPADEGAFGFAGYTTNDSGSTAVGQMASGSGENSFHTLLNPYTVKIGDDDRIYWSDNSGAGAIVACDILATTNQLVICEGPGNPSLPTGSLAASIAYSSSSNNYSTCPEGGYLDQFGWGIRQFDVTGASTTNGAIWLCDYGDYPSWGVWVFHLTNGAADPADTLGTQAVQTDGLELVVTGAGIVVDNNLDIFIGQNRSHGVDPLARALLYTNWNAGVLPPEGGNMNDNPAGIGNPPAAWAVGSGDTNMTLVTDTVINSRANPTMVAVCMAQGDTVAGGYNGQNGGIRVLSALDGSIVASNLDLANWYDGVAFDNVGNVYGASRSANYWRVWSPPGTNQATTAAVAQLQLTASAVTAPTITSITMSGGTVTITFTGAATDSSTAFTLLSSSTVNPASSYLPAAGAIITGSGGTYTATVPVSGSARYYRIKR